jgi:predicted LPLAT superfamily acyltransferase
MSSPHWKNLQERGGTFTLQLMLWFYRLGGRYLFRFILIFVIGWYWLFAASTRQASLQYLRQVHDYFADKSPFKHRPTLFDSYRHLLMFGLAMLDKIAGWLGDMPKQVLNIHGHEHFKAHYGRGAFIITSHFGNIELIRALKADHHQVVNVLVHTEHAESFNQFLKKLNPLAGVRLIHVGQLGADTAIVLQERLDAGEWVVIAADRVPIHSNRVQSADFMGKPALWPEGAWILASLMKCPVMSLFCYQQDDHYEVFIDLLAEQIVLPRRDREAALSDWVQRYAKQVEFHCQHAPLQWFNFYHFWDSPCDTADNPPHNP